MASDIEKGGGLSRRRHAVQLLLPFLAAALLAFLLATAAFGITHGDELAFEGGEGSDDAGIAAALGEQRQQQQGQQQQQQQQDPAVAEAQRILETRTCGSPAVDGYAHVKPECLEASPTNQWWQEHKPKPADLDIHIERRADYDGLAVGWGIGNTKGSVEECAQACLNHVGGGDGVFGRLPCNAFAWCGHEKCFEPDAHSHSKGDCWLKFTEGPAAPEVNMRGRLSKAAQKRHPEAPAEVQWSAGVILPRGVRLTNGSWSPRHDW